MPRVKNSEISRLPMDDPNHMDLDVGSTQVSWEVK